MALIGVAPLIYWCLGAPFLVRRRHAGLLMAPLLGGAIAGLACEFAYAAGGSAWVVISAILLTSLIWMVMFGRQRRVWENLRITYLLYLIALVPTVASPFPVIGTWDGDWLLLYQAGRTLWEGGLLSAESLQRPPLFGAAVGPLWLFADGLIPYQIFCAVMSAGMLSACLFAAHLFWPNISRVRLLTPLVLAPFFLHHTAACWGKLMAAGLLLAAAVDLSRQQEEQAIPWATIWFAFAVAVHQSSLLYAPLLLAIMVTVHGFKPRLIARSCGVFALSGFFLFGLFELWTILTYSFSAKVAANPAVAQRDYSVSLAAKTGLAILTSLIGWSPIGHLERWMQQPDALSVSRAAKELFWFLTSWIQVLAGTFLGSYAALLIAGGKPLWRRAANYLGHPTGVLINAGIVLVIVLNSLLCPTWSQSGLMQTGLTGLGLGGFLWLSAALMADSRRAWLAIIITSFLATLPWFALNLGISTGAYVSWSFAASFFAGSEGDWQRIVANNLSSLGLSAFPMLQLFVAAFGSFVISSSWKTRICCSQHSEGLV